MGRVRAEYARWRRATSDSSLQPSQGGGPVDWTKLESGLFSLRSTGLDSSPGWLSAKVDVRVRAEYARWRRATSDSSLSTARSDMFSAAAREAPPPICRRSKAERAALAFCGRWTFQQRIGTTSRPIGMRGRKASRQVT